MLKRFCSTLSILFVTASATFLSGTMITHAANCTEQQAILKARGQNIPCNYSQPSDLAVLSGGCADAAGAIQFLKSRSKRPESIDKLTPEFACKLKEFIEQAPGHITVGVGTYEVTKSKFNGDDCTRYQCKEGSNTHPLGCAADLFYDGKCNNTASCAANPCNTIASCIWAHQNAEGKGLQYRLMPGHPRFPGTPEPWHIELKDGDLSRCQGGSPTARPPSSGAPTPTSGLGNFFRQALGLPQQISSLQPAPVVPAALETTPLGSFTSVPVNLTEKTTTALTDTEAPKIDPATEATKRLLELAGVDKWQPPQPQKVVQILSQPDTGGVPPPAALQKSTDKVISYFPTQVTYTSQEFGGSQAPSQPWYDTLTCSIQPFCVGQLLRETTSGQYSI